jgi:SAM-dependent methyltransferase
MTVTWPRLVCPVHSYPLVEHDGTLECAASHQFPVVGSIPRFVASDSYAAAFGAQWQRYRRTQLDSNTRTTISADRLRRCVGDQLWRALPNMTVLECGCGAGRFTEVLLQQGARVMSVDLSIAVEANRENCPISERHRILQADLTQLPFEDGQFDLVICLGVLQHTPSPEASIAALYRHVSPGGALVIDHYAYRRGWMLSTGPLVRCVLKRLPAGHALGITERMVKIFFPLHRAVGGIPGLRSVIEHLIPVISYTTSLPQLDDSLQRDVAMLDTHDSLTDWYKHFRTLAEVRRTLEMMGLEGIEVWTAGNGIEARGRRPLSAGQPAEDLRDASEYSR